MLTNREGKYLDAFNREIIPEVPDVVRKRYYVRCETNIANKGEGCGRILAVHTLQYIQEHHYISPYSCTGGDYWSVSDDAAFICPKCGYRNRLKWSGVKPCKEADPNRVRFLENSLYEQFGSIVHEYGESCSIGNRKITVVIPIPKKFSALDMMKSCYDAKMKKERS